METLCALFCCMSEKMKQINKQKNIQYKSAEQQYNVVFFSGNCEIDCFANRPSFSLPSNIAAICSLFGSLIDL